MSEAEGVENRIMTIGRSYLPLLRDEIRDKWVVCEGRRGTAKTASILKILMKRAIQYPESRWLLARSTRERLSDSAIHTFDTQVLPAFGLPVPSAAAQHRSGYTLANGSHFIFMSLDDPARGQSLEIDGGLISEGVELARADQAMSLAGALRYHGVEVPFRQMFIDCNPGPPNHWLNTMSQPAGDELRRIRTPADYRRTLRFNRSPAAGKELKRIITSMPDNPGYFDTAAWAMTKNGQEYLDGLGYMSPHRQKSWIDGLWVQQEGGVFPEFDADVHLLKDNFEPPDDWPQAVFYDPGYGTTAILWICISPSGEIIVYDEVYEGKKSIEEHCAEMDKRNEGRNVLRYYGDPNEMFSSRAQGKSCADQAKLYGYRFVPWPADKGSAFDAGVEAIRHALVSDPGLLISPRCTGLIGNFQSWAFKTNSSGEMIEGADKYEKANDHALDCLRGCIQSQFLQRAFRDMQAA